MMEISARNTLEGTVENVKMGMIMASIKIKVESPMEVTAIITAESAEKLEIKEGDTVSAIIKATEVMVGK